MSFSFKVWWPDDEDFLILFRTRDKQGTNVFIHVAKAKLFIQFLLFAFYKYYSVEKPFLLSVFGIFKYKYL